MSNTPGPGSQIVTAAQALVKAVNITQIGGSSVAIELRKQLNPRDGFPILPVQIIAVQRCGDSERFFGSTHKVPYELTITLVTAGRLDFTADLPAEFQQNLDWQSYLAGRFREPQNLGLSFVWHTQVTRNAPVDTSQAEKGLNFTQFAARIIALEVSP